MKLVNVSTSADGAAYAWAQVAAELGLDATNGALQTAFYEGGVEAVVKDVAQDLGHATVGASRESKLVLDEALRTARLESAQVLLTVRPARRLRAADAGAVRAGGDSQSLVVDLGVMRTITGIAYLGSQGQIDTVSPWTGAQFAATGITPSGSTGMLSIPEQFTERLLLGWSTTAPDPVVAGQEITLSIPDPPGGLELRLGNRTLWTHPQEVQLNDEGAFSFELDFTQELKAALDSGSWPLSLVLTATVPALLTLEAQIAFERQHRIELPGGSLVVSNVAEGERTLEFPLGNAANQWLIEGLDLSIAGEAGEGRSVPSHEPSYSSLAELVVDPDHTVVANLPAAYRRRLRRLHAIRLPLRLDEGASVEIASVLRGGSGGEPSSEQLGVAEPVIMAEGSVTWVELQLLQAVDLETDPDLWIELNVTRGRAIWPLWDTSSVLDETERVHLRRGRPGGPYQPFTVTVGGVAQTLLGVLRLVGEPYADADLPALEVRFSGQSSGTAISPGPSAREFSVDSETPATVDDGVLSTIVQFRSAGTYRVSAATVRYRLNSDLTEGIQ